jgi:hypothetical protein
MTITIEPVETTNLDRYGFAPLPWSRPRDLLDRMAPDDSDADRGPGLTTWLATTSPGGRTAQAEPLTRLRSPGDRRTIR